VYSEDELLPISGLQHLIFCERQAALIHVEQIWADNRFTVEGSHLHHRVDEEAPRREVHGDLVILRGLALRSLRLGLSGRADVVELHRRAPTDIGSTDNDPGPGVAIGRLRGRWQPYPVDYKRGKPKADRCDEVQLCAQALCIEEMLGGRISEGALFYGRQRRRHSVLFEAELRAITQETAGRFHDLVARGETPRVPKSAKCKRCSLLELCIPSVTGRGRSARRYVQSAMSDAAGRVGGA